MPASTRAATSSARSPAKMSKTGVAGYIVSFPIPEVVMGINAFMLGAQSVNPDFKVKIVWVNSWFDPAKEADAAKALFDQGADIIVQHTDSPAPLQIAEERGPARLRPGARHDRLRAEGPAHRDRRQLGALLHRTHARRRSTAPGRASPPGRASRKAWWRCRAYTNMPDDVKALAEETEAKISAGELHPVHGARSSSRTARSSLPRAKSCRIRCF